MSSSSVRTKVQICAIENEIWDFWVFDDRILELTIHFTSIIQQSLSSALFPKLVTIAFKKQNPNQSTMTNWRNEAGFGLLSFAVLHETKIFSSSISVSGNLHSSWDPRSRALRRTEILYMHVREQGLLGHADRWTYLSSRVLDEWMEQERKRGRTQWWGGE